MLLHAVYPDVLMRTWHEVGRGFNFSNNRVYTVYNNSLHNSIISGERFYYISHELLLASVVQQKDLTLA